MRNVFRILLLAAILLLSTTAGIAHPAAAQSGRQVWAYYFGWYTGDSWNDGRLVDRPAQSYNSTDGGAIGRHIDEARGAGIDAFVMSWFGPKGNNLTHQTFNTLLDLSAQKGFHAAASVDMQEGGFNASTDEVLESLRYLIGDRVNHPGYLRYNGKPVIYFWNQGRFSVNEWADMRAQTDPDHNTIWVMEGTNTGYLAVFDGLYLFNTAWGNNASVSGSWMTRTRNAGGSFYTPTVMPGWDESRIDGRSNPTAPQDRAAGGFLQNSWNGATASGADVILIVSWNEYLENSYIEPSQNLGTQALDTVRSLIAAWKGGAPAPAPAAAAPAGEPTGVTYDPGYNVRLRGGPSTEAEVVGNLPYDAIVQVIGRSGDNSWVQVNFDGVSGWAAGWLGSISGDLNAVPVTG